MLQHFTRRNFGFYFSPDPAPGGGNPPTPPATPPAEPPAETPPAETPDNKKPPKGKVEWTPDQQAEINRIVTERLEREKKKAEGETEKARKQAEEAALAKNQEWQKLAETRQAEIEKHTARIGELEPIQEKAERYGKALDGYVKTLTAGLPAHIKALLDKMDPVEQIEYITANKDALGVKTPDGVPPSPPPDGNHNSSDEKEKAKQEFRKTARRYFG